MRVRTAILELLKIEPERRKFFKQCCEMGVLRLRSQAWQWRDEFADSGSAFSTADIEDALMVLARKFFPESPASEWDPEGADGLCKDTMARLAEHYSRLFKRERDALDLSVQDSYEESIIVASEANDPAAFRYALKVWEQVSLEALDRARVSEGAA